MKVNGYQLREGIKRWLLQRDAASSAFKDSLFSFNDEDKSTPDKVMLEFDKADHNLARLEEIQQCYNRIVLCNVMSKQITLALCVKLVGGAGRREKMWREAAVGKKDRFSYREEASRERDSSKEYAKRVLSVKDCSDASQAAAKYASALRNAIARGNATEVEVANLVITDDECNVLFD